MTTAQAIYDKSLAHIRKQGTRAHYLGSCKYRTEEGLQCVAGCHIPDGVYSPAMERSDICSVLSNFDGLDHLYPHRMLLLTMQVAHDSTLAKGMAAWEARMAVIAFDNDLVYSPAPQPAKPVALELA